MKAISKNQKHLIFLGFVVLLCLSAMAWFMNNQLKKQINLINNDSAFNTGINKRGVLVREFGTLTTGFEVVRKLVEGFKNKNEFLQNQKTLETVLIRDQKVGRAWAAIVTNADTAVNYLYPKPDAKNFETSAAIKQWVSRAFKKGTNEPDLEGLLVQRNDSLHWLVATKVKLADASALLVGIDVNLKEFQKYLWGIPDATHGYAIVMNEEGICILHPEIRFIGKRLLDPVKNHLLERIYRSKVSIKERAFSNYLGVPVLRSFTTLKFGPMPCIMAIDTPIFVVEEDTNAIKRNVIGMGALTLVIILCVVAFLQKRWQREFILRQQLQVTTEKQEKENALLQLKVLKDKVNPHFLFNSMGSLNALIDKDPKLAREFVVRLSRVYRYLLDSYPNGQATVKNELDFADQYWFLLNIRFGEAILPLKVDIKKEHLGKNLPFLSLQIAMENAVKHNVVSKGKPLKISIESDGDEIVVTNNYQLRGHVDDSGKQGISYLMSTYHYFGAPALRHGVYGDEYRCYFPLL